MLVPSGTWEVTVARERVRGERANETAAAADDDVDGDAPARWAEARAREWSVRVARCIA